MSQIPPRACETPCGKGMSVITFPYRFCSRGFSSFGTGCRYWSWGWPGEQRTLGDDNESVAAYKAQCSVLVGGMRNPQDPSSLQRLHARLRTGKHPLGAYIYIWSKLRSTGGERNPSRDLIRSCKAHMGWSKAQVSKSLHNWFNDQSLIQPKIQSSVLGIWNFSRRFGERETSYFAAAPLWIHLVLLLGQLNPHLRVQSLDLGWEWALCLEDIKPELRAMTLQLAMASGLRLNSLSNSHWSGPIEMDWDLSMIGEP